MGMLGVTQDYIVGNSQAIKGRPGAGQEKKFLYFGELLQRQNHMGLSFIRFTCTVVILLLVIFNLNRSGNVVYLQYPKHPL